MIEVVGIRFKQAGKIYYFSPGDLQIAAGDGCIVETARGVEYGEVVLDPKNVPISEVVQPLKQVLRIATVEDYERLETNKARAKEAFQVANEKIGEHKLPMRLLEAEYTLDENKLIFTFTADGRVDFRELVKDLAAIFRTRIELRQVGVRDEAKAIGGLGACGRSLCCATFLGDFEPVSIKMAKDQNLSLNPAKISGVCGRLMCCLKYESATYEHNKQTFGKSCQGCGPIVTDEFYNAVEDEPDYYNDLLKEDSIQEVDYQMLLETQEIDRLSKDEPKRPRPGKKKRAVKNNGMKGTTPVPTPTPSEGTPKKKKRPRRRKPKVDSQPKDD